MKSIINKKIFFILIFTCCGCSIRHERAPYLKYVDEIVNQFANEMQKEYGLICIASGGQMPQNVETIKVIFNAYHKATIEEARKLLVQATERLVEKINTHEKIRPFLKEYPFTFPRSRVSIWFHKPRSDSYYLDGSVAFVSQSKGGNISYDRAELQMKQTPGIQDLDGSFKPGRMEETDVFILINEEPYEEAVRIVHSKHPPGKKASE